MIPEYMNRLDMLFWLTVISTFLGGSGMPSDSLLGHRESLSVFQRSEGIRDQESKELFCQRFRRSLPCSGDSSYHPDLVPALDDIRVMLEPDEAILETELRNDSLFLLLITRDTFTVNRVSFSADRKQLLVELIRKLKSADHRKVQLLAPILSGILLGPVWETLRCYKRLIVIPSPDFTALPFEILPLPGEKTLLLERMEVLYQTSAWRWYATRQKPHRSFFPRPEETWWAFAGLAPSNRERCARVAIPATWAELEEVGDMLEAEGLPGQLMGSESASEEHFRMMLARSDIVHLATHVMQDHRKSGYPALMLQPTGMGYGDDGIHTMDEFRELHVESDLLVLNTCASATGPAIPLEGTGSLLRGFLQAGVPHVIGTLWNLSDQHAKDFVVRFYRYSIGGSSFSTALRRAKLDFLSSRQTSNPFFWAPYVIYGD